MIGKKIEHRYIFYRFGIILISNALIIIYVSCRIINFIVYVYFRYIIFSDTGADVLLCNI